MIFSEPYRVVLQFGEHIPAEIFVTRCKAYAEGIFKMIADSKRAQFEREGRSNLDWSLSLYRPAPADSFEALTFRDGDAIRTWQYQPHRDDTQAYRERFLSARELEGLDD